MTRVKATLVRRLSCASGGANVDFVKKVVLPCIPSKDDEIILATPTGKVHIVTNLILQAGEAEILVRIGHDHSHYNKNKGRAYAELCEEYATAGWEPRK